MSKFHVGDRVQIYANRDASMWLNGSRGVVTKAPEGVTSSPGNIYNVGIDAGQGTFWFTEDELRPADIFAQADEDLKQISDSATQQAVDNVNHPPHYSKYPVEVIEITEQLDFNKGNAVKYILRAGHKAGVDELEDLSKAAWYINRAIEKLKKERES